MSSPLKSALLGLPLLATAALLGGCGSAQDAIAPTTTVAHAAPSATSGSAGTSGTSPTSAAAKSDSSGGSVATTCPSASVVSAAIGETVPAPVSNNSGQGELSCNYNDPNTSANVVIGIAAASGYQLTDAILKTTADSQASAQGVQAQPVSGYGDAAYIFTLNDASTNSSGVATSILLIKVGNTLVDITAQNKPSQVEALARVILNG